MAQDPLTVITRNDEAGVDFILNDFVLPAAFEVVAKGMKFTMIATDGIWTSQAALDIVNGYATLTATEEIALLNFLTNQDLIGNLDLIDEMQIYAFTNIADSLRGMKGVADAVNNGATHVPQKGFDFDGVDDEIDSGFNPLNDGVNYTLNDARADLYARERSLNFPSSYMLGDGATGVNRLLIAEGATDNNLVFAINSATRPRTGQSLNPSLLSVLRSSALNDGNAQGHVNTVNVNGLARGSNEVPNQNIIIGGGVASPITGIVSTASWGAQIGFNGQSFLADLEQLLVDITTFSAGVQTVIDGFPVEPTNREKLQINDFWQTEIDSGNVALMDDFVWMQMTNPQNAVWKWISQTAMIPVNSPTFSASGITFNGTTQYLDSNIDPSTLTNYALNNALMGAFMHTRGVLTTDVIGLNSAGNLMLLIARATDFFYNLNAAGSGQGIVTPASNQNQLIIRDAVGNSELYINGVSADVNIDASTAVPAGLPIFIGARNNGGTPSAFSDNTLSSFVIGAAIGFDHTSFNTALHKLVS